MERTRFWSLLGALLATALVVGVALPALAQRDFLTFESGPVRPVALSPDGTRLFVTNIPDDRLEIFDVVAGVLTHTGSVPVGMEPVAVAARTNDEVWVVNHLSDSISIVDLTATPPTVTRTLLVGDEPRDIVFAGATGNRAFITTAHRGQQRTDPSIASVPGAGDPQLTSEGIGRADVWVFDATNLGTTMGGTPVRILTFFGDTPRALAATPDGGTVYVAVFQSGNQTTSIIETSVCDGFDAAGPCNISGSTAPGGIPGPDDNMAGAQAPETGLIVKFDGSNWRDVSGRNWSPLVRFDLPDHDVFSINANTLSSGSVVEYDHVGTILFNMAVNPVSGKVYVTNTESPNDVRFEGPGNHGGSTVQGHLSESRITVLDPSGPSVDPQHLNQHIDYSKLHTDVPDLVDTTARNHSLATPLQPVVSSDGSTIYMAAFGSAKIGVFSSSAIEDASFESNFDPTVASASYLSAPGGGPAGLALDEGNDRLYVLTRFDNSVSAIDLTSGITAQTIALHNPEPPKVIEGRPFLYDAFNTSGNGEASCASCHIFGDLDGVIWNLGDPDADVSQNPNQPQVIGSQTPFHPMKGPMTTQTLRGLQFDGGMHWRGDRVNGFFGVDPCSDSLASACNEDFSFRNFIVAFEGLVGHDGVIATSDMQKFADFALEIVLPPNPVRALDNSLNATQAEGKKHYFAAGEIGAPPGADGAGNDAGVLSCNQCHTLRPSIGAFGTGGAQSFEGETQEFKIPHLRNAYSKIGMFGISSAGGVNLGPQVRGSGFLHDGAVDTLKNFLSSSVFNLTNTEELQLEQFVLAFDNDIAPIVGQQVTLDATNAGVVGPRIDLMIQRQNATFDSLLLFGTQGECEVVVKGNIGGALRGFVRLSNGMFQDDLNNLHTDAEVRAFAVSDGPLTYTCVPPGSGQRMGIDRDGDDLSDGVETATGIYVGPNDTGSDPANPDTDGDGTPDGLDPDPNNPNISLTTVPLLDGGSLVVYALVLLATGFVVRRRLGFGAR